MIENEPIAEHLKTYRCGEANAVTSRELETIFHIRGPDLRREVNRLRGVGFPICSCDKGYYFAETEEEIERTRRQLLSRIKKIAFAARGMTKALAQFTDSGQLSLLPEGGNDL